MRKYYRFFGRVQGVGFRYRARHAASLYGVTGFVRNLDDGSVEMEAEGTEEAIDRMLQAIGRGMFIEIDRTEARQIPERHDRDFETH